MAGENGETWNPTGGPNGTGAYEKPFDDGSYKPPPVRPTGTGGWSNGTGDQLNGSSDDPNDPNRTLGKAYSFDGHNRGGTGAWGGYAGTFVDDGHGGTRYDAGLNGRQEAVDRARGLADAASKQSAYQIDYGQADKFAGLGQDSRGYEQGALELARQTARGENLQSQALGQGMLQQGLQAQQAGAASTRGGSLAAAAAMRQQASGAGSFMAQGQTQLDAQRAAEMATGRDMYQQQAGQMRAGDAQAQGLNQQQGISQMQQELGQRQLNQAGQLGYESQGQNVNNAANDAALKSAEMAQGIDSAASLRAQRQADRDVQTGAAVVGTLGAVGAKAADMYDSGGGSKSSDPDPYSTAVSNSDERGKTNIRGLASVARRGMR